MKPLDAIDLDTHVERFEEAWNAGPAIPELMEFLPLSDHASFASISTELIRIDMERRSTQGEFRGFEEYLTQVPSLRNSQELLRELAFEDYRLRLSLGEDIRASDYEGRFGVDTEGWPDTDHGDQDTEVAAAWSESTVNVLHGDVGRLVDAVQRYPVPGERLGDFTIVEILGRGKFAKVYLARQGELADRHVVLKMSSEAWEESEKLSRLQHTNIVPIYSIHQFDGLQAICMPFLGRRTLRQHERLADFGESRRLTQAEEQSAAAFAAKIAAGLWHAHQRGIIHRDLKPENILIDDSGDPLILDFNLSDNTHVNGASSVLVGGTLPYMAPEQISSVFTAESLTPSVDIFALGVIFFELLAGEKPFRQPAEGSFAQVLTSAAAERKNTNWKSRLSNVASPDAVSIVEKCLEPNLESRYATIGQLQEDLKRHADSLPLKWARNVSARQRIGKWAQRNRERVSLTTITGVAAVLLLVLGAIAAVNYQRNVQLEDRSQLDQQLISMLTHGQDAGWSELSSAAQLVASASFEDVAQSPVRWKTLHNDSRPVIKQRAEISDHLDKGDYQLALSKISGLLESEESNSALWLLKGFCHAGLNDFSEAEICMTRCISLSSSSPVGFFHRGITRLLQRRFSRAAEDFRVVLSIRPGEPGAAVNLAIALSKSGDTESALLALEELENSGIDSYRALALRRQLLIESGRHDEAQLLNDRLLEMEPKDAYDWAVRADLVREAEPYEAIRCLERSLERNPRYVEAMKNLAAIYAEDVEENSEALNVLRSWQSARPQDPRPWASQAVLYARTERDEEAIQSVQSALQRGQDAETYYYAASAFSLVSSRRPEYQDRSVEMLNHCLWQDRTGSWFRIAVMDRDLVPIRDHARLRKLLGAYDLLHRGTVKPDSK